jgi:hypothetical protein
LTMFFMSDTPNFNSDVIAASSPTTYKATSINYKPSNNDNNYSHLVGKSFIILLVKHCILVHIQELSCLHHLCTH